MVSSLELITTTLPYNLSESYMLQFVNIYTILLANFHFSSQILRAFFFFCQSILFSSTEFASWKEVNICFTKSYDVFFMTLLPLFMQTRGGGERTTYWLDVQTLDGTNGFYEDHSGEDQ